MNRNTKIHLAIALMLLCLSVVIYVSVRVIIINKFEAIERLQMEDDVDRISEAIAEDMASLETQVKDMAWSNETYKFMSDQNKDFLRDKITAPLLGQLGISGLLLISPSGDIVIEKAINSSNEENPILPQELKSYIQNESPLIALKDFHTIMQGIIMLGELPVFACSSHILTSDGKGPSHGILVMLRNLDKTKITKLKKITNLPIIIYKPSDPAVPQNILERLIQNRSAIIETPQNKIAAGYALMLDINGKPAFVIKVLMPAMIYEQAHMMAIFFLASIVAFILIFWIISAFFLNKEQKLCKMNEELTRINNVKTEFTSIVSHELRTPLGTTKQAIEIMLEGIDGQMSPKQCERLTIAKRNVDRLVRLTNDVLDFAKLESGRMELNFDNIGLNELLSDIHVLMKPAADAKKLEFALETPEKSARIRCDEDRIRQVIINLLDNAIKFTEEGGKITLHLEPTDGEVRIEVKDTGRGMSKEDISTIFEPFRQIHVKGATKPPHGSGLGLSICKQIIEMHGGKIKVESEPGKGSSFIITLPVVQPK